MSRIDEAWKRQSVTKGAPAAEPPARAFTLDEYPLEQSPPRAAPRDPVKGISTAPPATTPRVQSVAPYPAVQPGSPRSPMPFHEPVAGPCERIVSLLDVAHTGRGLRAVMVTSAVSHGDQARVAVTLARGLSEALPRVLLVDANVESPSMQEVFDVMLEPGLSAWLQGRCLELPVIEVAPHLYVLPAGRPPVQGGTTLSAEQMHALLEECASIFDFVVLDTPPVSSLPEARLLAHRAGAVVFVISGRTPFSVSEQGMTQLGRTLIVGTVLSDVPDDQIDAHRHADAAGPVSLRVRPATPGAR